MSSSTFWFMSSLILVLAVNNSQQVNLEPSTNGCPGKDYNGSCQGLDELNTNDAPWTVTLFVITKPKIIEKCAGTLISPKLVLTARECLARAGAYDKQQITIWIYSKGFKKVHIFYQHSTYPDIVELRLRTAVDVYIPKAIKIQNNTMGKIYSKQVNYTSSHELELSLSGIEQPIRSNLAFLKSIFWGSGLIVDCPSGKCLAGVVTFQSTQVVEFFTDGCPLEYYDEKIMKIYKCEEKDHDFVCRDEIWPPIVNKVVQIECAEGYQLVSELGTSKSLQATCSETKWVGLDDNQPRCTKYCNATEVNHLYALKADCFLDDLSVNCSDHAMMLPGTRANFSCAVGFSHINGFPSVKCEEDGTWQGLEELLDKPEKFCSIDCMQGHQHTIIKSKKDIKANVADAPWTVAIYWKVNRTAEQILADRRISCSGSMIRLDLILTAAHCLFMNEEPLKAKDLLVGYMKVNTESISELDQLREVQNYWLHPEYNSTGNFSNDIAILQMTHKAEAHVGQGIACLPWLKDNRRISQGSLGFVDTWSREAQSLRIVAFNGTGLGYNGDHFNVSLEYGQMLCKGESGSALVMRCKEKDLSGRVRSGMCLVGVVNKKKGGAQKENLCTPNIVASNLLYERTKEFIEFHITKHYNGRK